MTAIKVLPAEWPWQDKFAPAPAVRAGDLVYVSGTVAFDADGTLVGAGDLLTQADQIFSNIRAILARAGLAMTDVVKMTTFYTTPMGLSDAQALWALRQKYFGVHRPASIGVRVAGLLHEDMLIEMDAIAYAGND